MTIVTRFAPSPTGRLHLGHAHAALFAARAGQRFLLRIKDIDTTRCRPEFVDGIFEDLAWLGLAWETPVRRQSEHFADYAGDLVRLRGMGLLYPCFCTRADIARSPAAPHGPEGVLYPGRCRALDPALAADRIAAGTSYALRLDVGRALAQSGQLTWRDLDRGEQSAAPETLGDVVLARKEVATSYHLAVTTDDARQGVTVVTRGEDLFHATHVHRLLQALLDLPVPVWRHHGLLRNERGERLAKRDSAATLQALRLTGTTAAEVRQIAGFPD